MRCFDIFGLVSLALQAPQKITPKIHAQNCSHSSCESLALHRGPNPQNQEKRASGPGKGQFESERPFSASWEMGVVQPQNLLFLILGILTRAQARGVLNILLHFQLFEPKHFCACNLTGWVVLSQKYQKKSPDL